MKEMQADDRLKEWAKLLYTRHDKHVEDIVLETGVDEATIHSWVRDNGWYDIKRSLLTSKTKQLATLYSLLEAQHTKMSNAEEITTKDADLMIKYTTAINNLETGTPVTTIIEVAELFVSWLRHKDLELTKKVIVHLDDLIMERSSMPAA